MRLFAKYYNRIFINNLGDNLILDRLSSMCNSSDVFLDLCCGSGRVLTFPLNRGVKAVGIDNDTEMLLEARIFLENKGYSNYELIKADALDLNFDGRFKVITCVGHCMSFFKGKPAIQRLLERVYKALVRGGLFFIESYVPGNPKDGFYRRSTFNVNGGELICTLSVSIEVNGSDNSVTKLFTYDLEIGDRKEQEVYRVCDVYLPPIIKIAKRIGFTVEGIYGDSNATVPFYPTSETQSLLLKKM
ncbi:MAG: class I SAM-dependent methyltransferase [Pseudomonadota bacterium]